MHPQNYNDLINAYDYFNTVYTNSSKDGHIETAINYLYYIASIEYKNGDYDKSDTSIVKAKTINPNSLSTIEKRLNKLRIQFKSQ